MINYDDDEYSHGYSQIKETFEATTKDDKVQPYISDKDPRLSNDVDDIVYNLYVFGVRYQKHLEAAQPIKVQFQLSEKVPAGI